MKVNPITLTFESARCECLIFMLLLILTFGLAAYLHPHLEAQFPERQDSDDPLAVLLGDTRQMFANSFFIKADVYFHSGYYPTIYDDNSPFKTAHMAEDSGAAESKNTGDEDNFLGQPHDWIDRLNRNMFPSHHSHLDEGGVDGNGAAEVKEIMPWLKISAELDAHRIETYLVTAYWLRVRMHKVDEAEQFLRDGLRANPGSAAILFELGQLYNEGRHDPNHARNLYLAALDSWGRENSGLEEKDKFLYAHITGALAKLEESEHNLPQAIEYFKLLKTVSAVPDVIQQQIDDLIRSIPAKP